PEVCLRHGGEKGLQYGFNNSDDLAESRLVVCIEVVQLITVDVQHQCDITAFHRRQNDFGTRRRTAGNVAGELVDVWDHDRLLLLPGHSANTFAETNPRARYWPLNWTEHQLV